MLIPVLLLAALAQTAWSDAMAPGSAPVPPPERIQTLVVYGRDACPRSDGDEIVVCARQPESERYRIPKALRQKPLNDARDGSWAGTARALEYVSRDGRPNSCSPVGTFGQTGCFQRFIEDNRHSRAGLGSSETTAP